MREDPQLSGWLAGHRDAVTNGGRSDDHPDVDTLARHATGQLSPYKAREVSQHLLACDDGRCVAFIRAQSEDVNAAAELIYPPQDDVGGHSRTFQCREALWQTFEQMSTELNSPLDELLEEAMLSYARARGQIDMPTDPRQRVPAAALLQSQNLEDTMNADAASIQIPPPPPPRGARARTMQSPTAGRSAEPPTGTGSKLTGGTHRMPNAPAKVPTMTRPFAPPSSVQMPPPPPARAAAGRPIDVPNPRAMARPMTAPIAMPPPGVGIIGRQTARGIGGPTPAPASSPSRMPPALPPGIEAPPATVRMQEMDDALATRLVLVYEGRSYTVDKEKFLLGRSKSQADLKLEDANVSRQHAMIEAAAGNYFVVDLGSTNGVYVNGERVARRALRDGDLVEITTHKIQVRLG